MKKLNLALLLTGLGLMLAQAAAFAGGAFSLATANHYAQDRILIKFKPKVATAARALMAQTYGAQSMQAVANHSDLVVAKLAPGQSVAQVVGAYSNDPNVEYAQPDYIYHALAVPNETQYSQLWAAKNTGQTIATGSYTPTAGTAGDDMNLEPAWDLKTDCSSVLVAVVDTGVNYNSEDLLNNMWTGNAMHGNNFAADGAAGDPMDLAGHGTHVAGIIGAEGNNGKGSVGVCWKANIMAVRVLDATGTGSTSTIIAGINYAVTNGAKIINMSLGGTGAFDQAYSDAITNAQTNHVLVVVAAGNDNVDNEATAHWPCNFTHDNLICVAALDQNYALANFSDWGAASVDVGAPGTNIYSTWAGSNTVQTDLVSGVSPTGWTGTSTTLGTGGGWGGTTNGFLINPKLNWTTAKYNANTDDRVWKSFNIPTADSVVFEGYIAVNVNSGDYFNINYMTTSGDPFAGSGTALASVTNWHDGTSSLYYTGKIDIKSCVSATCTLGFQLKSALASTGDFGVAMTNFTITSLTNNATSYHTIDGTSMASPEVAGVAALVWAYNPQYTYADVANAIKNGGRSISALSGKTTSGKAVDALGSLSYINQPTGVTASVQ
jgi:thermitase